MDTIEKNREVLNDLIRINNDRVDGYEKAIKETKDLDDDLRSSFRKYADDSVSFANELRSQAEKLGADVAKGNTAPGKIYHAWMDVKTTISGNTRESILSACEFGEDAAQKAYNSALNTEGLNAEVRSLITRQQSELRKAHDTIRNWRDQEKGGRRSERRESKPSF